MQFTDCQRTDNDSLSDHTDRMINLTDCISAPILDISASQQCSYNYI